MTGSVWPHLHVWLVNKLKQAKVLFSGVHVGIRNLWMSLISPVKRDKHQVEYNVEDPTEFAGK